MRHLFTYTERLAYRCPSVLAIAGNGALNFDQVACRPVCTSQPPCSNVDGADSTEVASDGLRIACNIPSHLQRPNCIRPVMTDLPRAPAAPVVAAAVCIADAPRAPSQSWDQV